MRSHRCDPLSLVGAVVFLAAGSVGLLQAAGWIDDLPLLWAAVTTAAGLGAVGLVSSLRALTRPDQLG